MQFERQEVAQGVQEGNKKLKEHTTKRQKLSSLTTDIAIYTHSSSLYLQMQYNYNEVSAKLTKTLTLALCDTARQGRAETL